MTGRNGPTVAIADAIVASIQPRGLSRIEAARYVGIGTTKFDQLVADRRMPRPKQIDGRTVWDRIEIDIAFSDLPHQQQANPFD